MYDTTIVTDDLTLEKILSLVDEYHIFTYYLGKQFKVNKPISSPFREDKNPSWVIFRGKNGDLMYKDFATGDSGDVVDFVRQMFDLKYMQTLQKIWEDIITKKEFTKRKPREPKKEKYDTPKTEIGITRKYFTDTDDKYWEQYGIDREILKHFDVYPIKMYWVNGDETLLRYSKAQPMYAYSVYNKFKIYRPNSVTKKDKWRNNCGPYDLQGLPQLKDNNKLLILTKSLKDVMVLYKYGYSAIAAQSEQSAIPPVIIEHLKQRFDKIVVFYDYDDGGVKGAEKLANKYELDTIFIPKHYLDLYEIKDISDFAKEMGEKKTKQLLKELFDG